MAHLPRICGCTTEELPPPNATAPMAAVSVACEHGQGDWTAFSDINPGFQSLPLATIVAETVQGMTVQMETNGKDWFPHTEFYLFHYAEVEPCTNFCAALHVRHSGHLDMVWDPCPKRPLTFHSRMDAGEWALREFTDAKNGSVDFTFVVID